MTLAAILETMKPAQPMPAEVNIIAWSGALDAQRMRQARAGVPCQQRVTFSLLGDDMRHSLHGSGLANMNAVTTVNRGWVDR